MPLPQPISRRSLKHTRAIQLQAFARDDGLWDIDAHISDIKAIDIDLASGVVPAGHPIHSLWLRLTINTEYTIVGVDAASDEVPYRGHCDTAGPAYKRLIGLNLTRGFRHQVKERMGGINGCTHLTELAQILPTAAIQAFAGTVYDTKGEPDRQPFQLDRCHALRTDGEAVARFYPRWAVETPETEQIG